MAKLMLKRNVLAAVMGAVLLVAGATTLAGATTAQAARDMQTTQKPTVVLLHGAWEDGSSWSGVTARLQRDGYTVVAPAVALRGIASDTSYLRGVLALIPGPKVLVGHSYGGALISQLADTPGVMSLVYVAAFIPEAGETLGALNSQFPGSEIGPDTTYLISYDGGLDVALKPETAGLFGADIPAREGAVLIAAQRSVAASVFTEPVELTAPAAIPKYAVIPTGDKAIAPAAERFMAARAGATIVEIPGASHLVQVSEPVAVTKVIERAAR
ncbi:MAG: alpha/beta fold hydrolase [Microbacterium sp.]